LPVAIVARSNSQLSTMLVNRVSVDQYRSLSVSVAIAEAPDFVLTLSSLDRVIFCCFSAEDLAVYQDTRPTADAYRHGHTAIFSRLLSERAEPGSLLKSPVRCRLRSEVEKRCPHRGRRNAAK
jgi:hypothetical protein